MNKIRIVLADDHAIVRDGLRNVLNGDPLFEVVGEAADGGAAFSEIEHLAPDVAIVDISMPGMNGIELTRRIKASNPGVKIMILSMYDNEEYVDRLIRLGVMGYMVKDDAIIDVAEGVMEIMQGNLFFSKKITKTIVSKFRNESENLQTPVKEEHPEGLSEREIEVLKLIARGMTSKEIGTMLDLSDKTINVHRANILRKLKSHKSTDMVKYAIDRGLI